MSQSWKDGSSNPAGAGGGDSSSRRSPQRLTPRIVFMPSFTNPLKDSKTSENRRLVAKWAMINRPKPALAPITPPGSAPRPPGNAHRSPQGSTSPLTPAPTPPTPESNASTTPSVVRHDSPPFGLIHKSTDYYSLPNTGCDQSVGFVKESNLGYARPDEHRQRHHAKQKARRRVPGSTHSHAGPVAGDDDDFMDEDSGPITTLVRRSPSTTAPITMLPPIKDPFDCLPVRNNPHTHELLYLYLNAQTLSPAFTQGNNEIGQRVKTYRQNTWFPLILQSKATLNALIAYIESTPDLPIKARNQDFLYTHVQAAYEGMRFALSNPRTETDDAICVAVVLLMLTAQRLGDNTTFRAHATGLMHLLGARSKAFRTNKALRDLETERWAGLNLKLLGPPNPDRCKYCQDAHLRPVSSRSPSPEAPEDLPLLGQGPMPSSRPPPVRSRGVGFFNLVERGYLSEHMSDFIEQILIWTTLAEQARRDRLSAAAAASHAWIDERPGKLSALDTACQYSVRLCLYLSSWLEGGHSCTTVRRMASAVYAALRAPSVDISHLLTECPHILLWMSFVAGPFVEDDIARQWFMCLLVRARDSVAPQGTWEFEEVMEQLRTLFVWTHTMTPGARRFWNENSWDVGTATVWMESPF